MNPTLHPPNVNHDTQDTRPDPASEPQPAKNQAQNKTQIKINYRSHQRITIRWRAPVACGARQGGAVALYGGRVGLALTRSRQRGRAGRRGRSC
jgi:hypothetical protein